MSYDIVKSAGQAIQQFGGQDDIDVVVDRMKIMLKSAQLSDWQKGAKFKSAAESNLRTALVQAAQVSVFYGLVPGVDLHLIPFGNDWAVDVGFESWKRAADQFCEDHGITYHAADIDLTADEIRAKRGKDYDPEDVGVKIIFMRSDKDAVYNRMERMGLQAEQIYTVTHGFWRKKANEKNGKWREDTVPVHRDRRWVAWKRAMKAALKAEFSLQVLAANNRKEFDSRKAKLESELRFQEVSHSIVNDAPQVREDDGDIMWATEDKPKRNGQVEAQYREVEDLPTSLDEVEAINPEPQTKKVQLSGKALQFAEWCRGKDHPNSVPATADQYKTLAAILRDITGKDCADVVMSALLDRDVSADATKIPSGELTSHLIDWLRKFEGDGDHRKVRTGYREDFAEVIVSVHDAMQPA